jgi:hypothetical protein
LIKTISVVFHNTAVEKGIKMTREVVTGTLIGVRDGPVMVIGVMGQEKKYPLDCEISIEWAFKRMNTMVVCQVEDGRIITVG